MGMIIGSITCFIELHVLSHIGLVISLVLLARAAAMLSETGRVCRARLWLVFGLLSGAFVCSDLGAWFPLLFGFNSLVKTLYFVLSGVAAALAIAALILHILATVRLRRMAEPFA